MEDGQSADDWIERFTFRIPEDSVNRAKFLSNQGPYINRSDVYRTAIRAAWYDHGGADAQSEKGQEAWSWRGNVRISRQMRKRLDELGEVDAFGSRSAAVRYGLDQVWKREMSHEPSKRVRQG